MSGNILNHTEISKALAAGKIKLEKLNSSKDKYINAIEEDSGNLNKKTIIQPSSLDLRAGEMYLPPDNIDPCKKEKTYKPRTGVELKPGHTVVIETLEKITFDKFHTAIVFPPAHLAQNAMLMADPGHIDPGFSGHLRFTLINMGRKNYTINYAEPVATMVMFSLNDTIKVGYQDLSNNSDEKDSKKIKTGHDISELLEQLSPDFASFTNRMETEAQKAVNDKIRKYDLAHKFFTVIVPAVITLIGLTLGHIYSLSDYVKKDMLLKYVNQEEFKSISTQVLSIEDFKKFQGMAQRIETLEKQLAETKKRDKE